MNFTIAGEKPLKCPFPECPKQFASKANMYKHMKTHDKTRFEGLLLQIFILKLFESKILWYHANLIFIHHTGPPPHVCDHCGKGFYILGTLYHHRRKKHLGLEKMYIKRRQEKYLKPSKCDVRIDCAIGLTNMLFYDYKYYVNLHIFLCSCICRYADWFAKVFIAFIIIRRCMANQNLNV